MNEAVDAIIDGEKPRRTAFVNANEGIRSCVASDGFLLAEVLNSEYPSTSALFISEDPRDIEEAHASIEESGIKYAYSLCNPPKDTSRAIDPFRNMTSHKVCLMDDSTDQLIDAVEIQNMIKDIIGWLRDGNRVLVHCSAGVNRSSAIVALVLCTGFQLPFDDAIFRIREAKQRVASCWLTFDGAGGLALHERVSQHTSKRTSNSDSEEGALQPERKAQMPSWATRAFERQGLRRATINGKACGGKTDFENTSETSTTNVSDNDDNEGDDES